MSIFGVILSDVHFSTFGLNSVRMPENADQNNSEYWHFSRSKPIRGHKDQNSAGTRCRGFLVLEPRCRGFLSSEKTPWNHDVMAYLSSFLDVMVFWSWNLDVVVFWSWNLDVVVFWSWNPNVVVYVAPRPRFCFH